MQQDSSEAGPLDQVWRQSPNDYVPLSEAIFWVAIKGGKDPFTPDAWHNAWKEIKGAWCLGELEVCGRRNGTGFPQPIQGINIAGVDYVCPYGGHRGGVTHPSLPGPHIDFCPHGLHSTDLVSWEAAGLNDILYVPGQGGWTHLMVLKADVLRIWPFGAATLPEVSRPKPESAHNPQVAEDAKTTRPKSPVIRDALTKLGNSQIGLSPGKLAAVILKKAREHFFDPDTSNQILQWYKRENGRPALTKLIKRIKAEQNQ